MARHPTIRSYQENIDFFLIILATMRHKHNTKILLCVEVFLLASETTQNAWRINVLQCCKQVLEQMRIVSIKLSVKSVEWRPRSLNNVVALEQMGLNDSKMGLMTWRWALMTRWPERQSCMSLKTEHILFLLLWPAISAVPTAVRFVRGWNN